MTFEELQKANESIMTMTIERKDKKTGTVTSKEYAEVPQRIKVFRILYPEGSIVTEMLSDDGERCVFRAVVSSDGKILGTGTAFELKNSSFINASSYIENCETSAVGRALAMCGIGIDVSVASYEEVANAKLQQSDIEPKTAQPKKSTPKPEKAQEEAQALDEASIKAKVLGYINRHEYTKDQIDKICATYKVESLSRMTLQMCQHYINFIEKNGGHIDE